MGAFYEFTDDDDPESTTPPWTPAPVDADRQPGVGDARPGLALGRRGRDRQGRDRTPARRLSKTRGGRHALVRPDRRAGPADQALPGAQPRHQSAAAGTRPF